MVGNAEKWLGGGIVILLIIFVFSNGGLKGFVVQDIIRRNLKDPDSAKFHSTEKVWEKKHLALFEVDFSAKNGFGGMDRAAYCVCLNNKKDLYQIISTDGGCETSGRIPASGNSMSMICESYYEE